MYLLDTDTYSLYLNGNRNVVRQYYQIDPEDIFLSDVTVNEVLKGRLAYVNECGIQGGLALVRAYSYLREQLEQLRQMNIIPYNMEADAYFASYDAKTRRAGTNDCRIACSWVGRRHGKRSALRCHRMQTRRLDNLSAVNIHRA